LGIERCDKIVTYKTKLTEGDTINIDEYIQEVITGAIGRY
jgi:hypothetical protein